MIFALTEKAERGNVSMKKAACAVILAAFALANTVPAAAESLGMENTLDSYGYGEGSFAK